MKEWLSSISTRPVSKWQHFEWGSAPGWFLMHSGHKELFRVHRELLSCRVLNCFDFDFHSSWTNVTLTFVCLSSSALNNCYIWEILHTPQLCRHTFTVKDCWMNETEVAECCDETVVVFKNTLLLLLHKYEGNFANLSLDFSSWCEVKPATGPSSPNHPSIFCNCISLSRSLEPILAERWGTPCTCHQFITGHIHINNHVDSHSHLGQFRVTKCKSLDCGSTQRTCKCHSERPQLGFKPSVQGKNIWFSLVKAVFRFLEKIWHQLFSWIIPMFTNQ